MNEWKKAAAVLSKSLLLFFASLFLLCGFTQAMASSGANQFDIVPNATAVTVSGAGATTVMYTVTAHVPMENLTVSPSSNNYPIPSYITATLESDSCTGKSDAAVGGTCSFIVSLENPNGQTGSFTLAPRVSGGSASSTATAANRVAVSAVSAPSVFTVTGTASPSGDGTISSSSDTVNAGGSVIFTAAPNSGYAVSSWASVSGGTEGSDCTTSGSTTCTVSSVTGNVAATVNFVVQTYTVTGTASPSGDGTISPSSDTVNAGGSVIFTAAPNSGYAVSSWASVSGGTEGSDCTTSGSTTCTVSSVTGNVAATVNFVVQTYTVTGTASPSGDGTISPSSDTVNAGGSVTFTANPNSGYGVSSWSAVTGGTPGSDCTSGMTTCTVSSVSGNVTATANFVQTYTVTGTASPSGDGTISPSSDTVNAGGSVTFTANPNSGYGVSSWSAVTGGTPGSDCTSGMTTCTVSSVSGNVTATANFVQTYTVTGTASPSGDGTISPSSDTVNAGGSVIFTAAPNSGYAVSSWASVSGGTEGSDCTTSGSTTCTVSSVTGNVAATVNFVVQTYTVTGTASPSGDGTISPSSDTVNAGGSVTFTANPNSGYGVSSWSAVTGGTPGSDCTSGMTTCTVSSVSGNVTATANFVQTYTVTGTASPSGDGTISPSSDTVNAGGSVTFTANPNSGYAVSSWASVSGGTEGSDCTTSGSTTCTVSSVTGNVAATVNFVQLTAATPTFTPAAGDYTSTQSVSITSSVGAAICYTTDGMTTPAVNSSGTCSAGTLYTGPISVSSSETIQAIAGGSGFISSAVGSAAYAIYTISVTQGSVMGGQMVTIRGPNL